MPRPRPEILPVAWRVETPDGPQVFSRKPENVEAVECAWTIELNAREKADFEKALAIECACADGHQFTPGEFARNLALLYLESAQRVGP